jgi:hypothetical protein
MRKEAFRASTGLEALEESDEYLKKEQDENEAAVAEKLARSLVCAEPVETIADLHRKAEHLLRDGGLLDFDARALLESVRSLK